MKANEAPEKIYVDSNAIGDNISTTVDTKRQDYPTCTEYTRTDAFIEKAWGFIEDNLLSSNQQDKSRLYYEQFKNYMKGE